MSEGSLVLLDAAGRLRSPPPRRATWPVAHRVTRGCS